MAPGNFEHIDVGPTLSRVEFESGTTHHLASQATGDLVHASSAAQLSGLAIGGAGNVLTVVAGLPAWSSLIDLSGAVIVATVPIQFDTGVAVTPGAYEIARNADGTNLFQFNVPTGAALEFSVNDVQSLLIDVLGIALNGLRLIFDPDRDTYFESDADDRLELFIGGGNMVDFYRTGGNVVIDALGDMFLRRGGGTRLQLTATSALAPDGLRIGADSGDNEIDDATQGAASTQLFIGNSSIDVTVSDRRAKVDITAPNGLAREHLVKLVSALSEYDFKAGQKDWIGNRYVGHVAQQLNEVLPEYVLRPADGKSMWSVKYNFMVGPLLWGWRDHEDRIRDLEEGKRQLERELEILKQAA